MTTLSFISHIFQNLAVGQTLKDAVSGVGGLGWGLVEGGGADSQGRGRSVGVGWAGGKTLKDAVSGVGGVG